jgi:hypothetical protein
MTPVPATIARLVPMTAMHTQNITAVNIRGRLTAITADATTVVVGTGTEQRALTDITTITVMTAITGR